MIPPVGHFVWLGPTFPWLNALAVVSAAKAGGFERIVLHVGDELEDTPHVRAVARHGSVEIRRIDLGALARATGERAGRLQRLYDDMPSAAARSDVLRALILGSEGGVYLDVDTVTVADFAGLRASPVFVGQELICFPEWSARRQSVGTRARAYGLSALRWMLARVPDGYRFFARVQHLYALAVNNAVLGAEPGHAFMRAYIEGMLSMPPELARRRYAIGPHLLARICREQAAPCLALLSPSYFYPLGPVMSELWWSRCSSPDLDRVLSDQTVTVHWYASVRSRKLVHRVDSAYVQRHRDHQLFSKLASRYLDCF
jgi:hypothetical protein